ncbi:imelysin family protein [Ruegeria sp.]|uniref:imelysin family protein n=1 Tax=Ruegeria sp. TaxID=1879320 RepID=UPI00231243CA|nr:imelysin family protein [Ruegeria sp.]MDA7966304.1 imelysin family protein [Ruegeria sp.]
MRTIPFVTALLLPLTAMAQDRGPILDDVTQSHILPRFAQLAEATQQLKAAAEAECAADAPGLRDAYHAAFDDWISASHLRFGPTETGDRAFAIAFWPDTKGFTPKALSQLIAADTGLDDPDAFAQTSIAGRGFFALEQMLYDPAFAATGEAEQRCAVIRAITTDINRNADAIAEDWQSYALVLTQPGADSPYRSDEEALQELFKALSAGLQFTSETRLGRPLGTFDRPRPNRAEARRSGRALRHVELSLVALRDLAARLSVDHPDIATSLDAGFNKAITRAQKLEDPVLAGVATPQGRLRVEALQQEINDLRAIVATELGPTLGISAGFNSLDGD